MNFRKSQLFGGGKISYPRQCPSCKKTYSHQPSFSIHKHLSCKNNDLENSNSILNKDLQNSNSILNKDLQKSNLEGYSSFPSKETIDLVTKCKELMGNINRKLDSDKVEDLLLLQLYNFLKYFDSATDFIPDGNNDSKLRKMKYQITPFNKKVDTQSDFYKIYIPKKTDQKKNLFSISFSDPKKRKVALFGQLLVSSEDSDNSDSLNMSLDQTFTPNSSYVSDMFQNILFVNDIKLSLADLKSLDLSIPTKEIDEIRKRNSSFQTGWLVDVVIEAYFHRILAKFKNISYFPSQFSTYLQNSTFPSDPLQKFNFSDTSKILFPCNSAGNHWTLMFIDITGKLIEHYDTLNHKPTQSDKKLIENLIEYLNSKFKEESNWKVTFPTCPKQSDSHNCGVFVCYFGFQKIHNSPLNQFFDTIKFRKKIFDEIAKNCLENEKYTLSHNNLERCTNCHQIHQEIGEN